MNIWLVSLKHLRQVLKGFIANILYTIVSVLCSTQYRNTLHKEQLLRKTQCVAVKYAGGGTFQKMTSNNKPTRPFRGCKNLENFNFTINNLIWKKIKFILITPSII